MCIAKGIAVTIKHTVTSPRGRSLQCMQLIVLLLQCTQLKVLVLQYTQVKVSVLQCTQPKVLLSPSNTS